MFESFENLPMKVGWSLRKALTRRTLIRAAVIFVALTLLAPAPVLRAQSNFPVIKTINVDISPFGATTSPDGRTIWVANSGSVFANSNKLTIIDIASLSEEPNKITVGRFPEDIAFVFDGSQAFVTNSSDATVSVIDTATKAVIQTISLAPLSLTFPFGVTADKNDKKVFISTQGGSPHSIAILDDHDPNNVQLDGTVAASGVTGRMALRSIGNELVVTRSTSETGPPEIIAVNPSSGDIMHDLTIPGNTGFTNDIAITPDGRFAYVSIFDFSGGTGGVWVVDLKTLRTVTVINTGDPEVFGIGITPNGHFVFATNFIKNSVAVIDTTTNTLVATVPVGRQPNEVAVTLDGTLAFVTNQNDTTVSVISIPQ